jgi:predicted dehydrogenase
MPALNAKDLQQTWPLPLQPRPITLIGAGGIVRYAHLPAYAKIGLKVAGIFDLDRAKAEAMAQEFGVPVVHDSLDSALAAGADATVYDLALPPAAILPTVERLPVGACALIQKPLGHSLADARAIVAALDTRRVTAATNFQLRFTPSSLAIHDAMRRGLLGDIVDVDVHIAAYMPWELWSFMPALDAVEIPLHSIHYLDWFRSLLGEPAGVYAKTVPHPRYKDLKDARSSIILDYPALRCCLSLNQTYRWGPRNVQATIQIEGTRGCARVELGYLIDYLKPVPERLEMIVEGGEWTEIPLAGERHPDAFGAIMSNLQRFAAGEDAVLSTDVHDSLRTMALVDACLRSSRQGGVVPLAG